MEKIQYALQFIFREEKIDTGSCNRWKRIKRHSEKYKPMRKDLERSFAVPWHCLKLAK
jgi:hypothetical protein